MSREQWTSYWPSLIPLESYRILPSIVPRSCLKLQFPNELQKLVQNLAIVLSSKVL